MKVSELARVLAEKEASVDAVTTTMGAERAALVARHERAEERRLCMEQVLANALKRLDIQQIYITRCTAVR